MKRILFAIVAVALFSGAAQAQQKSWIWWGATNPVPVSADNPLPVTVVSGGGMNTAGSNATAAALGNIATAATGCNDVTKYVTGTGTCVTPAAGYSAPTIGSTPIPSGSTVTTIAGLTLTSPTLTTPALGVATGTSLALGGATIGANALAVTGASLLGGTITGITGTDSAAGAAYVFGSGNTPYLYGDTDRNFFLGFTNGSTAHEFQASYASGTVFQPVTGAQSFIAVDGIEINYNNGGIYLGLRGNTGHLLDFTDGITAVGLEVFNTVTSTTNYESGLFDWTTTPNVLTIGSQIGGGGGTARDVVLVTGGTAALTLKATTQNVITGGSLTVGSVASATGLFVCESGGLLSSGVTTCVASDRAVKRYIEPIADPDLLTKVLNKRGVRFEYEKGKGASGRRIGVIANDWEADFPELVDYDSQGIRHFDYAGAFGLVIEAMRVQETKIEMLERRN